MRVNSYVSSSSREQLLLITFMNRFDAVISHPSVVPSDLAIQRPQCMEWIHFTFKFHTAPYLSIQSRLKLKMWNKTWNSIFCLALLIHFQSKYLIILVGFFCLFIISFVWCSKNAWNTCIQDHSFSFCFLFSWFYIALALNISLFISSIFRKYSLIQLAIQNDLNDFLIPSISFCYSLLNINV